MMTIKIIWDTFPSEHRRAKVKELKRVAENAEIALEGLYTLGPTTGLPQWQTDVWKADREVTRAWHEWASLVFYPLINDEPIPHTDWNGEEKCCGQRSNWY